MVGSHSRLHFKIFFGILLPFFPFEIQIASLVQVFVRKKKNVLVGKQPEAKVCHVSFFCFLSSSALSNLNESPPSDKGRPYNRQQVQARIREILGKYSNGFWVSKLPQIYRELYKQDLPTEAIKELETWSHICIVGSSHLPTMTSRIHDRTKTSSVFFFFSFCYFRWRKRATVTHQSCCSTLPRIRASPRPRVLPSPHRRTSPRAAPQPSRKPRARS